MYVKIVRYHNEFLSEVQDVIPESTVLIQSKVIEYFIFKCVVEEQFNGYLRLKGSESWSFVGEPYISDPKLGKYCGYFILFKYLDGNEYKYVVAQKCKVYVMSDDGKTIDSFIVKNEW